MNFLIRSSLLITCACLVGGCERLKTVVKRDVIATSSGDLVTVGDAKISFNESIQPILSENCYHCHGPDSGTREPK